MTRAATPEETADVMNLIAAVLPNKTIISRDCILDFIGTAPGRYPAITAIQGRQRTEIVTRVMNQNYPAWNQTAQKPKARAWVLNREVAHVTC